MIEGVIYFICIMSCLTKFIPEACVTKIQALNRTNSDPHASLVFLRKILIPSYFYKLVTTLEILRAQTGDFKVQRSSNQVFVGQFRRKSLRRYAYK